MLSVNYKFDTPQQRFYSTGVKGDNKANKIRFIVPIQQKNIRLSLDYTPYLKLQNKEHRYCDKIEMIDKVYDDNFIYLTWLITRKSTQYKHLEMQLIFENINEDIVFQTLIAELEMNDFINADKEIAERYPSILMSLQKQINDIVEEQGNHISLDYTNDSLEVLLSNNKGKIISQSSVIIPTDESIVSASLQNGVITLMSNGGSTTTLDLTDYFVDSQTLQIELDKKVDKTTKINNYTLDRDVDLDANDVGTYSKEEIDDNFITNAEIDALFN
jgi:hypothetical protein